MDGKAFIAASDAAWTGLRVGGDSGAGGGLESAGAGMESARAVSASTTAEDGGEEGWGAGIVVWARE